LDENPGTQDLREKLFSHVLAPHLDEGSFEDFIKDNEGQALHILQDFLTKEDLESKLRHTIIDALDTIRLKRPELAFNRKTITKEIETAIREYINTTRTFDLYRNFQKRWGRSDIEEEQDLFLNAQRQRINETLERIFRLLGLLCEPADMRIVHQGFLDKDGYVRAQAVEFLDNVVDMRLRQSLHSLLDLEHSCWGDLSEINKADHQVYVQNFLPELKKVLNNGSHAWGQISALYIITRGMAEGLFPRSS